MKLITFLYPFVAVVALVPSLSIAAMPKSEILLAKLNTEYGLKVSRVTGGDNYNNQPLVTNKGIYFTQEVISAGRSQTDLAFYDFKSKQITNLTNSSVSEYSPTLMPNKKGLSAVVVEADKKQKLWHYPLNESATAPSGDTAQATRIFEWIEPVGYHAWGNNEDLVMFILGKPHTLQYTSVAAAKPQVVATNIGRTLLFNEENQQYLFSYQKEQQNWLATFNPQTRQVSDVVRLPQTVQDFTLVDDNTFIYALNNRVYQRQFSHPDEVSLWLDLTPYCETSITRLSYFDNQLAFVCKK